MACRKCGGGGSKTVSPTSAANANNNTEMILVEYIGEQNQKRRLRSKVNPREQYVFSGDSRRFLAYRRDAEWLISMATQFRQVNEPTTVLAAGMLEEVPVLVSMTKAPPVSADMPLDVLTIDPITLALLKKSFHTIAELRSIGRSGWMTIKGIGASRADAIEEALNAL